jgi:hypothetical protein
MNTRPERGEAADYYFTYIDQVAAGDICEILAHQIHEVPSLLQRLSEDQSRHRYAPEKWSMREVLSHINDAERVFVYRALWFARGFDTPLPSFDQNIALAAAEAEARSWSSHIEEFGAVRVATLAFFRGLPAAAWGRHGVASGYPFTVRALAYIVAGHTTHHVTILQQRYLPTLAAG